MFHYQSDRFELKETDSMEMSFMSSNKVIIYQYMFIVKCQTAKRWPKLNKNIQKTRKKIK